MLKTTQSLTAIVQSFNARKDESLHIADLESALGKSQPSQILGKLEKSYIDDRSRVGDRSQLINNRSKINISKLDHSVIGKNKNNISYLGKLDSSIIGKRN